MFDKIQHLYSRYTDCLLYRIVDILHHLDSRYTNYLLYRIVDILHHLDSRYTNCLLYHMLDSLHYLNNSHYTKGQLSYLIVFKILKVAIYKLSVVSYVL